MRGMKPVVSVDVQVDARAITRLVVREPFTGEALAGALEAIEVQGMPLEERV